MVRIRLNVNFATTILDDLTAERQADTGSGDLATVSSLEHSKDLEVVLWVDSGSVVDDQDGVVAIRPWP